MNLGFKRSVIYLVMAWGVWIITGYLINVGLGRYLGPQMYGIYGLVMSILLWLEIFIITGVPYAVQKFVASDEENAYSILRTAGFIQCIVIGLLFVLSFFTAPLLAKLFNNDRLILYFRVAFINILFYGIFYLYVSFQNGLRHFGRQALLLITYSFSKLAFIFICILLFRSLISIFLAISAASIAGSVVGYFFIENKKKCSFYDQKQLIRFAFPALIFSLAINLILYVDFWTVTFYLGKDVSGFFFAAANIARVPYFFVLVPTAVVLPTVSNQLASHSLKEVKSTIQSACRILLLFSVLAGILITVYSKDIIQILYSSLFESASAILSILIWGVIFLAFLFLLTTVINADHRPFVSASIVTGAIVVDVLLNIILVPKYGAVGGAVATTIATGIGFLISFLWVLNRFRVFIQTGTLLRVAIAGIFVWISSKVFVVHGLNVLFMIFIHFIIYGVILVITKEISMDDILKLFRGVENIETVATD
ncbi:flippase [bacterium]|nr:flippase [bacterium]